MFDINKFINSSYFKECLKEMNGIMNSSELQLRKGTIQIRVGEAYYLAYKNGYVRTGNLEPATKYSNENVRLSPIRRPSENWNENNVSEKDYVDMIEIIKERFSDRNRRLANLVSKIINNKSIKAEFFDFAFNVNYLIRDFEGYIRNFWRDRK